MSNALSPIFYLFLAPAGKLYLKVQDVLAHDETHETSPPPITVKRRPGPKHPKYGIPTEHWTMIFLRYANNNESLRAIAQECGVSYETIRRIMLHVQMQRGLQEY